MRLNQTIYKISRPIGGLQLAKFLSRRHPKIIMYHRVSAGGIEGSISVDQFREQMRIVSRHFKPVTLSDLVDAGDHGKIPPNAVVITIDDGYKDFADYTWPIMQEEGVPATIFITTGFVNRDLWLWPDEIKYLIRHTSKSVVYIPELGLIDVADDEATAWHRLSDYCLTIKNQKKNELIKWLYQELEVEKPDAIPNDFSAVSWDQLKEMSKNGLEVGSHSHSHPVLTKLNDRELQEELYLSKLLISENLGIIPNSFCYPNGRAIDFDENVKHAVSAAGYQYAVAAYPNSEPLKDRWAINRYAGSHQASLFEKNLFGLSYVWSIFSKN